MNIIPRIGFVESLIIGAVAVFALFTFKPQWTDQHLLQLIFGGFAALVMLRLFRFSFMAVLVGAAATQLVIGGIMYAKDEYDGVENGDFWEYIQYAHYREVERTIDEGLVLYKSTDSVEQAKGRYYLIRGFFAEWPLWFVTWVFIWKLLEKLKGGGPASPLTIQEQLQASAISLFIGLALMGVILHPVIAELGHAGLEAYTPGILRIMLDVFK